MIMQHGKDSFWLQLEVCREYQRARCTRSDMECKFAHPPTNVEVGSNGRVTACYDSIKGRCQRETCKYMHPPAHLKDQLLINGRNHLALKNALLQQHHLQQEPTAASLIAAGAGKAALASQLPPTMAAAVAAVAAAASASSQQQQQQQHSSSSPGLSLPPLQPLLPQQQQHQQQQQAQHHIKQHQKHHQHQPQQQQAALFQSAVAAAAAANQQRRHTAASALSAQHLKQMPMVDPATLAALLAASSMNPFMVQGAYSPAGAQYSATARQYAALAAAISQSNVAAALQQPQPQPPPPPPPCQPLAAATAAAPVTGCLLNAAGLLATGSPVSGATLDPASLSRATNLGAAPSAHRHQTTAPYCPPTTTTTAAAAAAAQPASPVNLAPSSHAASCEQIATAYYMTPGPAAVAAAMLAGSQLGPVNCSPLAPGRLANPEPADASGGQPSPAPIHQPALSPTALQQLLNLTANSVSSSTRNHRRSSKRPRSADPHTGRCYLSPGSPAAGDSGKRVRLSSSSSPPTDGEPQQARQPLASVAASEQQRPELDHKTTRPEQPPEQPPEEQFTTSDAEQSLQRRHPIRFRLNKEY